MGQACEADWVKGIVKRFRNEVIITAEMAGHAECGPQGPNRPMRAALLLAISMTFGAAHSCVLCANSCAFSFSTERPPPLATKSATYRNTACVCAHTHTSCTQPQLVLLFQFCVLSLPWLIVINRICKLGDAMYSTNYTSCTPSLGWNVKQYGSLHTNEGIIVRMQQIL